MVYARPGRPDAYRYSTGDDAANPGADGGGDDLLRRELPALPRRPRPGARRRHDLHERPAPVWRRRALHPRPGVRARRGGDAGRQGGGGPLRLCVRVLPGLHAYPCSARGAPPLRGRSGHDGRPWDRLRRTAGRFGVVRAHALARGSRRPPGSRPSAGRCRRVAADDRLGNRVGRLLAPRAFEPERPAGGDLHPLRVCRCAGSRREPRLGRVRRAAPLGPGARSRRGVRSARLRRRLCDLVRGAAGPVDDAGRSRPAVRAPPRGRRRGPLPGRGRHSPAGPRGGGDPGRHHDRGGGREGGGRGGGGHPTRGGGGGGVGGKSGGGGVGVGYGLPAGGLRSRRGPSARSRRLPPAGWSSSTCRHRAGGGEVASPARGRTGCRRAEWKIKT